MRKENNYEFLKNSDEKESFLGKFSRQEGKNERQ